MELRHLRYFIVVAEEGSFTRAAVRLNMQQPPLSQQIRALEDEIGFELFVRHAKGIALTAAGSVFLQEARAVLASLTEATDRAARVATGSEGSVSIGITSSASAHRLIPDLIQRFRQSRPNVTLLFREGNAAELTEALAARTLDFAFVRQPVVFPEGVEYKRIDEEEMLLVLPAGHPLLKRRAGRAMPRIPLTALRDEKFILVRRHGAPGMYADLIDACVRAGFSPAIVAEVERMLTNISLVAAGVGVSAVPASMKGFHEDRVTYCRIQDGNATLSAPLTLAHRRDDLSPAARHFIALAESCIKTAPAGRKAKK